MKTPRLRQVSLTEGPITKGLIYFSVPLLISNLLQQLYNSVDSAVVGTFAGDIALSAVGGPTGSLINLLIGFFLGISTGTGILYAMHYGARDYAGLKKLIDSALVLSAGAGIVIGTLGAVFAEQMLVWMDTPADIVPEAAKYLRIVMGGMIVTMIYNVAAGMIRAEGDSTRPLLYLLVGGLVNLALDLLFVALLGWGVVGAAIATIAAQTVTAVLTLIRLTRLPEEYRFRFKHIQVSRLALWDITRISVPCGLQGSMFNISNLLVQAKINSFGAIAVAGVTAYSKIDGFIYMPVMAISLACSTYVGQNIGAGHYDRVKKGIRVCLTASVLSAMLMGVAVLLAGRNVIGVFTKVPESQDFAMQMMWYMAPFAWVFSFSDVLGGAIRGAGAAMKVTIITALCICVFRVIWLFALLPFINDIRVVFLCYPVSWALCSGVMTLYYFKGSAIKNAIRSTT
ncbi:MAG: MATE family efflux transporter [Oscillospiraceae bacterium]